MVGVYIWQFHRRTTAPFHTGVDILLLRVGKDLGCIHNLIMPTQILIIILQLWIISLFKSFFFWTSFFPPANLKKLNTLLYTSSSFLILDFGHSLIMCTTTEATAEDHSSAEEPKPKNPPTESSSADMENGIGDPLLEETRGKGGIKAIPTILGTDFCHKIVTFFAFGSSF